MISKVLSGTELLVSTIWPQIAVDLFIYSLVYLFWSLVQNTFAAALAPD